jgi:hypothetical protein
MPPVGHYFPSSGHLPGYGRLEIESADKPKPAESFHQSWGANSKQADPPAPLNQVPPYPPPVIVAPPYNQNSIQQNFGNPRPEPRDPRAPEHRP